MSLEANDPAEMPAFDIAHDWADLSSVHGANAAWAHSGVVVTAGGEVIGFHAGQVVAFGANGGVARIVSSELTEGHGITLVQEGDQELLWVSDPGFVFASDPGPGEESWVPLFGRGISTETRQPRVVKVTLSGQIVFELPVPPMDPSLPPGMMGQYCPCGTAVDEERFGGSGDIWVADGYGSSLVHRFDGAGTYLSTLDGNDGAGRFGCPHAVFIDRRPHKPAELYIADRDNRRVQVYDLQGQFLRAFGQEFLSSPSGFAQWRGNLVVAELYGRLAVLDDEDTPIGYIGADPDNVEDQGWPKRPGWPNTLDAHGHAAPPPAVPAERFNSPHSVAVDEDGNLFVSEWLIGGRYNKIHSRP